MTKVMVRSALFIGGEKWATPFGLTLGCYIIKRRCVTVATQGSRDGETVTAFNRPHPTESSVQCHQISDSRQAVELWENIYMKLKGY